jgi:hypothetical protein
MVLVAALDLRTSCSVIAVPSGSLSSRLRVVARAHSYAAARRCSFSMRWDCDEHMPFTWGELWAAPQLIADKSIPAGAVDLDEGGAHGILHASAVLVRNGRDLALTTTF